MLTFGVSFLALLNQSLFAPGVNLTGGCAPNATHGCLDSRPYEFATQFPCGSHQIYEYADHSCCEQGRPFSTTDEYCCTGSGVKGVHGYADGKCDLNTPDGCVCYDEIAQPVKEVKANADALIDTENPPEGGYLCSGPEGGDGCMNGWPYDYGKKAPCGKWLMEFGVYGCCPSAAGLIPYPLGSTYCCKIEGAEPGKDYQVSTSACKCHRYGCS